MAPKRPRAQSLPVAARASVAKKRASEVGSQGLSAIKALELKEAAAKPQKGAQRDRHRSIEE
eukprot:12104041-Alexandrium_andersonii.AAC.1